MPGRRLSNRRGGGETADTRIDELTREAEQLRKEAEDYAHDIRAAVDGYGTSSGESRGGVAQILSGRGGAGPATREATEEMAQRIQGEVQGRHEHMPSDESKALEERRSRVLDGLRDLSAQLQDLLASRPAVREDDLLEESTE